MIADTTQLVTDAWEALNNDYLSAGLQWLRVRLHDPDSAEPWWEDERWCTPIPPALEVLGETFGLSRFERLTLFLAAAPEWGFDLDGLRPTLAGMPTRGLGVRECQGTLDVRQRRAELSHMV